MRVIASPLGFSQEQPLASVGGTANYPATPFLYPYVPLHSCLTAGLQPPHPCFLRLLQVIFSRITYPVNTECLLHFGCFTFFKHIYHDTCNSKLLLYKHVRNRDLSTHLPNSFLLSCIEGVYLNSNDYL